jgi:hypothetical protein
MTTLGEAYPKEQARVREMLAAGGAGARARGGADEQPYAQCRGVEIGGRTSNRESRDGEDLNMLGQNMDLDPERQLWLPSRRRFFFLGLSAAGAAFLPSSGPAPLIPDMVLGPLPASLYLPGVPHSLTENDIVLLLQQIIASDPLAKTYLGTRESATARLRVDSTRYSASSSGAVLRQRAGSPWIQIHAGGVSPAEKAKEIGRTEIL